MVENHNLFTELCNTRLKGMLHFYVINSILVPMQLRKNIAISETGFVFNPTTGDSYSINEVGREILAYLKENVAEVVHLKSVVEMLWEVTINSIP